MPEIATTGYVEKHWLDFPGREKVGHDTFAEVVSRCQGEGIEIFSDISTPWGVLVGEDDVLKAEGVIQDMATERTVRTLEPA
ncbi:hypothetical protein HQ544_02110 [Candidatus Falkowbacteria bacterium]|nr:hypothetical protein [Candidatus Falkowbacteria bacterium]